MIWLQILLGFLMIYLLVGLVVAVVRISAHDATWQLFVFTIVFWPTLYLP